MDNKLKAERVVVGMSGGVDSSVAAAVLLEQGFDVSGLFMKNWDDDDSDGHCAAAQDLEDAGAVCSALGITLHTISFAHEYWERVFAHFLEEQRAGRTPNPDVLCNREIKFREFIHWSEHLGAGCIATGHYVRSGNEDDRKTLLKGIDGAKDQSYFLYAVEQDALARSLFPIGHMTKAEVRSRARSLSLPTHAKKDSTGICFIGERRFKDFLSRYLPPCPGDICRVDGRVLGRHDGLMYYTIGQRHGLGIGGPGEPWYVSGKDIDRNVLVAVQGHDHPALLSRRCFADSLHWISGCAPAFPLACKAKIRYRHNETPCEVVVDDSGIAAVTFAEPQWAVTTGQSIVFYRAETCLGGGTICRAEH